MYASLFYSRLTGLLLALILLSACNEAENPGPIIRTPGPVHPGAALPITLEGLEADAAQFAGRNQLAGQRLWEFDPIVVSNNEVHLCYTNVVVRALQDRGQWTYDYLPISSHPALNRLTEPPKAVQEDNFFKVTYIGETRLGYRILREFWDYIENNGGQEYSGQPIDHGDFVYDYLTDENTFQQCFERYCLINRLVDGQQQIEALPNGRTYCASVVKPPRPTTQPSDGDLMPSLNVSKWFNMPAVNSGHFDFGVMLSTGTEPDTMPQSNIAVKLILKAENQVPVTYYLPATDIKGESSARIEGFQAPDDTWIEIDVCIQATAGLWNCYNELILYNLEP